MAKDDEVVRRNGPPSASLPADYDPTREQEDDGFDFLNPGETERKKGTEVVERVKFVNVGEAFVPSPDGGVKELVEVETLFEVILHGGEIICVEKSCSSFSSERVVDLQGGTLLPPLVGYGTGAGLLDIVSVRSSLSIFPNLSDTSSSPHPGLQEKSTLDGHVFDPLFQGALSTTQERLALTEAIKAVDGLVFGGKHLQVAEGAGVGKALVFPQGNGFLCACILLPLPSEWH